MARSGNRIPARKEPAEAVKQGIDTREGARAAGISFGGRHDRNSPRKKQPFRLQLRHRGRGSPRFGNHHQQKTRWQNAKEGTENLPQTASGPRADDRAPDAARGDESHFCGCGIGREKDANPHVAALHGAAMRAHQRKIPALAKPGCFQKALPGPVRLGCGGQSGLRHLSGEDACALGGGGG